MLRLLKLGFSAWEGENSDTSLKSLSKNPGGSECELDVLV